MRKRIIGIVGPIAAGKDSAAAYLGQKLGWPVYEISRPLKERCRAEGLEPTRQNLAAIGIRLSHEFGEAYLAETVLAEMPERGIIAGMRQPAQIAFLREIADFFLIAMDADPAVRFARAQARGKAGEAQTLEEFVAWEQAENAPPHSMRVFECLAMADLTLDGGGSLDYLHGLLDGLAPRLAARFGI